VEAALEWLLTRRWSLRFIVYAGFAGALDPALQIADVLIADEVVDERGMSLPTSWPVATALSIAPPCNTLHGRLVTTSSLVADPQGKRSLATRHGAVAVDMEAFHVAGSCKDRAIPFGCVRAISDTADTALSPALVKLLGGSRVHIAKLLANVVRRPAMVAELWRLARDTRQAARTLSVALTWLISPPEQRTSGMPGKMG
jgi:adenosylhomocysteine nucleosidase